MTETYSDKTLNIVNKPEYIKILKKTLKEILYFLINSDINFNISMRYEDIEFEPKLTEDLITNAQKSEFFVLPIFNKNHIFIGEDEIVIELRLNRDYEKDDEGTIYLITIPLFSIFHLISKTNEALYMNQLYFNKELSNQKKSFELFLNNPDNKGLFKK